MTGANLRLDGPQPPLRAPIEVAVVDDAEVAASLAGEWDELVHAACASPFVAPTYALTWWRHRGRGQLQVVTARYAGQLVALAPLHARRAIGQRVLRWLGHGLGTVAEVLVRPGYAAAATAIWRRLAEDPRILLELVEYRDDGGGLIELRRARPWDSHVTVHDTCPVVQLEAVRDAEVLLKRMAPRNGLRRSVERARRRLGGDQLAFTVEEAVHPDRLGSVLPGMSAVYDAAEQRRPRLHLLRPPWRDFFLELLSALMLRGQAAVHLARIDGKPVGFEITFDDERTTYHWVSRFDPAFAAYSPGHLLILPIFDRAIARGAVRSDLLLGADPHKLPWAGASYDTMRVLAAPRALALRQAALQLDLAMRDGARRLLGTTGRLR